MNGKQQATMGLGLRCLVFQITTLNLKKRHWCCTLQLQRTSTDFRNFWQRCC